MKPIVVEDYNDEGIICDDESLGIKEKTDTSLNNHCCGDLSSRGKNWIHALKTVLVGANFSLMPVVYAKNDKVDKTAKTDKKAENAKNDKNAKNDNAKNAKNAKADQKPPPPPPGPNKPPAMKFTDLPLYESPHADYMELAKTTVTYPGANVKLLHSFLLPYVKKLREKSVDAYSLASSTAKYTLTNGFNSFNNTKNQVKQYMRDPNNLQIRQGVVAGGTLLGYLLGRGGGLRRVYFTGLGALAAGSLCFPKETDAIFKDVLYKTSTLAMVLYQKACR